MSDNTENALTATKRQRTIQMKDFRDNAVIKALVNQEINEACVGRVVGIAYGTVDKTGTLLNDDGSPKVSTLVMGDFQAIAEKPGAQPLEAGQIYLPGYFADEIKAATAKSDGGISFAVEVWMEKNPRAFTGEKGEYSGGVAYQYSVRNILEREKHDPLSQLKAKLAASGKLGKLPPPPGVALAAPSAPSEETAAPAPKSKAK